MADQPQDSATAAVLENVRVAIELAFKRGYEQGVAVGRAAVLDEITKLVANGTPAPSVAMGPPQYGSARFGVDDTDATDTDGTPEKKKRARRGSVPEAIDKVYAATTAETMSYQEIFDDAQALGYDDIALSSIRGEMQRRKKRGEAVEVVSGRWRLLAKNMAASQRGEATM